jgi:hypothetical protein
MFKKTDGQPRRTEMKREIGFLVLLMTMAAMLCCAGDGVIATSPFEMGRAVTIEVTAGEHFIHDMKIGKLLTIHNPPTTVFWIEDMEGNYIETLFVTEKVGTEGWKKTPGEEPVGADLRRPGSLPTWGHRRGVVSSDGVSLPTKDDPMPDAVTSASPKASYTLTTVIPEGFERCVIYAEFNNSTDFNDYFRPDLEPGEPGYSGNEFTGGQPAVVYRAEVDVTSGETSYEMALVGHSSPDGSDGEITGDTSRLTTATDMIEKVTITLK